MEFDSHFRTIEGFLAKFTSPEPWDKSYNDFATIRDGDMSYGLAFSYYPHLGEQIYAFYTVRDRGADIDEKYYPVGNNAPRDWFYDLDEFPFPVFGLLKPSLMSKIAVEFVQNRGRMPTCVEWINKKTLSWPNVYDWDPDREIYPPILPTRAYKL